MIDVLVTGGVGVLTSAASSFITWILAKKKYNAEVDNNIIQNMQQSLEFYKSLSDDNKERLAEVLEKNQKLEEDVSELRKQMLNLTMKICLDLSCKHRILESTEEFNSRYKE